MENGETRLEYFNKQDFSVSADAANLKAIMDKYDFTEEDKNDLAKIGLQLLNIGLYKKLLGKDFIDFLMQNSPSKEDFLTELTNGTITNEIVTECITKLDEYLRLALFVMI